MREILFRGRRIDNGEWVYGCLIKWQCWVDEKWVYHCAILNGLICNREPMLSDFVEVDPATIGQSTGLYDMNDTEVFDGDIVKSTALSNDHNQRGAVVTSPVEYWNGNACLSKTDVPIYPFCLDHELEIIGNIHDKE